MGFLKKAKEAMGGVDKHLIETGILASGLVVECRPTSVSTGNPSRAYGADIVCVVTVDVYGLPGHDHYQATCHHPIPQVYLPQMQQPGATVAVRVDPADPQHIALDLATSPPPIEGAVSAQGGGDQVEVHDSGVKSAEIVSRGLPCKVVVVGFQPLDGVKDSKGLDATGFVLSVFADGQAPYQVQIAVGVPPEAVPLVYAGANLAGKVLPEDPQMVTIDWQASLAAYPH